MSNLTDDIQAEMLERAAQLLKAMAHPMRIAIISMLKGGEKFTVTEIHKSLKIEQAVASHHLNILKNKKILKCKRNGKTILYSLEDFTLSKMVESALKAVN